MAKTLYRVIWEPVIDPPYVGLVEAAFLENFRDDSGSFTIDSDRLDGLTDAYLVDAAEQDLPDNEGAPLDFIAWLRKALQVEDPISLQYE